MLIEYFLRTFTFWFRHGFTKIKGALPIYLSCCFIVIMGCDFKPVSTEKRQKVFEITNSSLDLGYRLPNFGVDFVYGEVKFNRWINPFKFSMDGVTELLRGGEITLYSINNKSGQRCEQKTNNIARPMGERDKKINDAIHNYVVGFLLALPGLIILLFGRD